MSTIGVWPPTWNIGNIETTQTLKERCGVPWNAPKGDLTWLIEKSEHNIYRGDLNTVATAFQPTN
jgi:hypothetical protein